MLNLKKIREEKNINQKQLSQELNRTVACISSWETGKTEPSIDDLIKLANYFNVSLDYLLGRVDEYGFISAPKTYSNTEVKILKTIQKFNNAEQERILSFLETFIK